VIFAKGSSATVIPGDEAESILKKARMIMEKMDAAKEAGRSENPKALLEHGDNAI
jgi:4-hydroxy-4-methyl-2-oxoglutarate aldolase